MSIFFIHIYMFDPPRLRTLCLIHLPISWLDALLLSFKNIYMFYILNPCLIRSWQNCFLYSVEWTVSLLCPFLKENILICAVPLVSFWNCPLAYSVLHRRLCLCIRLEVIYSSVVWASHPGSCSTETWFLSRVRGENLAALFHRWRCRFGGTICRGDCLSYGVCCWHLWGEKESGWLSLHGFLSGSSLSLVRVCVSVLAAYRLSPVPCWDLKWTPWYFCCAYCFMVVWLMGEFLFVF